MSDPVPPGREWLRYVDLKRERAELFVRQHGPATVELLHSWAEAREAEQKAQAKVESGTADALKVGVVLEDPYVLVIRDPVRFPAGGTGGYLRIAPRRGGRVAGAVALPVRDDRVLLVRHFRHAIGAYSLELPRGFADGESGDIAIRRELQEEIGVNVDSIEHLGDIWPDNGLLTSRVSVFLARVRGEGTLQWGEGISQLVPMSWSELGVAIASGQIMDSFTLSAYALAKARGAC